VVFGPSYPVQPFGFVVLQYMVPHFMQENLFQHEAPEGIGWPIHQGCAGLRQFDELCTGPFESVYVLF